MWLPGALAALAACSPAADPNAEKGGSAPSAGAWVPAAGTYEFTRSDDAGGLIMVAEGGRYTAALSGGELEDGVWRREGALSCLVAGGPSERKLCYSFAAPDARGRSRGTGPAGTITLRKME